MKEEGFGRYNLYDNPSVTNIIVVDGPQHERTTTSSYSKEDYEDGYYFLEIYGYYAEKISHQKVQLKYFKVHGQMVQLLSQWEVAFLQLWFSLTTKVLQRKKILVK